MNKRVLLVLTAAIIVIFGTLFFWQYFENGSRKEAVSQKENNKVGGNETEVSLPSAAGDINSLVDDLFAGVSGEDQILNQDTDTDLVGSDSADINDFGNTYDENEL